VVSEEELARLQAALIAAPPEAKAAHKAPLAAAAAGAVWRAIDFPTVADAVNFANVPPAQQGGEFGVTDDPAGGVHGYYFF
jgi:hypothetical protein